jgi:cell division septation protein DedD
LAVIGGIVGYTYDQGVSQFEMPVISAESEPIKSQPESPGGLDIPYQGVTVLNNPAPDQANPSVESLLPSPESSLPMQIESVEAEAATELEALVLAGSPLEYAPGPAENLLSEAVGPLASAPEPPPVSAAQVAAPLPERPAPAATTATTPTPLVAPLAPQVAALLPTTDPARPYVVQLAALKSQDSARPAWRRLQKAHSALLSEREMAVQEVDLGERGIFHRVQAGYFSDRTSALELCAALKARGQDCLVVKR